MWILAFWTIDAIRQEHQQVLARLEPAERELEVELHADSLAADAGERRLLTAKGEVLVVRVAALALAVMMMQLVACTSTGPRAWRVQGQGNLRLMAGRSLPPLPLLAQAVLPRVDVKGALSGEQDVCALLQKSAGLKEGRKHAVGRSLGPNEARALWQELAADAVTLRTFAPRTALAYLLRGAMVAERAIPYSELRQQCERFLRLVVMRPDGYLASALTGEPLQRMGQVELRDGEWMVERFLVGHFYLSNGGVFYPVDENLRRASREPVGELGLEKDLLNTALDGAEEALGEMVVGLASCLREPVRTVEGLGQLPTAVAALIASSPEYFARYGNLPLREQVQEAARLSTHVLMLAGGGALSGTRMVGTGVRLPLLTLAPGGTLAVEAVVVPTGAVGATLGTGAGALVLMSGARDEPGQQVAPDGAEPAGEARETPGAKGVTRRPGSFRKKTLQEAWENAPDGAGGGKSCPSCDREISVRPGEKGTRRDWDGDHQPPWSKRDLSGKTRKEVLNEYNEGVRTFGVPELQQGPRRGACEMSMNVATHLEHHLGQMSRGWSSAQGADGVQVALFPHQPAPEVLTYATLGLSHHVLTLGEGRGVRQEFVLALHERFGQDSLAALLLHVVDDVLGRHRALLRGEVLQLGAPIVSQSAATDLYATLPVVFPDSFATFPETSPPTVFVWLVPIMREESRFIQAHGWSEFETLLEQSEVDLFDLARPRVV